MNTLKRGTAYVLYSIGFVLLGICLLVGLIVSIVWAIVSAVAFSPILLGFIVEQSQTEEIVAINRAANDL